MMQRLEIENFRSFDKLTIDGFARVNVFVGANNVGKTSVLEAIYLLQELQVSDPIGSVVKKRRYVAGDARASPAILQKQGNEGEIRLSGWDGDQSWQLVVAKSGNVDYNAHLTRFPPLPAGSMGTTPANAEWGEQQRHGRAPAVYFDFASLSDEAIAERIGAQIVKRRRERLIAALRRVDPRVVGIDQYKMPNTSAVEAWVDLGLPELMRLTQTGHGLQYATALFTELGRVRQSIVLIDEVETGLYHEIVASVWQAIDELSQENELQLFVTTHSYECLEAADRAMAAHPEDLAVFRLERLPDGRLAVFRLGPAEREAVFHYKSEVR